MKLYTHQSVSVALQLSTIALVLGMGYTLYQQQKTLDTVTDKVNSVTSEVSYVYTEYKKAVDLQNQSQGLAPGDTAPAFTLASTENTQQSLEDIAPKQQKLLVFSSANCRYCQEYYPELDQFAKTNSDIEVVLIQAEATVAENQKLKAENNFSFQILEATPDIHEAYRINGTPTTILVSETNTVQAVGYPITHKELLSLIKGAGNTTG